MQPPNALGGGAREALELGEAAAILRQQRGDGARNMAQVVQGAAERGRVVAGERNAQGVGRAGRLARREQALDRALAPGDRPLQAATLGCDVRGLRAQAASFGSQCGEGAVDVRDGPLRIAQRVARLPARRFAGLELPAQGTDPGAQLVQLVLPRRRLRGACREAQREDEDPRQTLAFPCAETAAMRFATSSASPR